MFKFSYRINMKMYMNTDTDSNMAMDLDMYMDNRLGQRNRHPDISIPIVRYFFLVRYGTQGSVLREYRYRISEHKHIRGDHFYK
jgi:hypothetical protein